MKKKLKCILPIITLFLSIVCSIPVLASTDTDTTKGSIQILLTDGDIGTSKENVEFEYVKIADIQDGRYVMSDDYGNINLNELKTSAELDEAAQVINSKAKADKNIRTDSTGTALIENLEIGVYLLRISDKARYENVTPVLIAIPTWDEEKGDMNYDVTVIPKHTPNTPGEIITNTPEHTESETILTGDNTSFIIYILLMVVSASIVVLYMRTKRRTGKC